MILVSPYSAVAEEAYIYIPVFIYRLLEEE